ERAESVERPLMHKMAIDPQQGLAVLAPHDFMRRPQLVEQGQWGIHAHRPGSARRAQYRRPRRAMLVYRAVLGWEGSNVALVSTGHPPQPAPDAAANPPDRPLHRA